MKYGEKQTFRALSRRSFKPRHATGKPVDSKVFQAHLKARYLGEGYGGGRRAGRKMR